MSAGRVLASVVIPTHNRRDLLRRLLESLEEQTLAEDLYEVIIVHNYTDDGTEQLALDWCLRQPFSARYFRKQYNGPTRSRHFGAQQASGEVIAFIDDDCVATPGWLAAGVERLELPTQAKRSEDGNPIGVVQGCTLPMPGQRQALLSKTVRVEDRSIFFETCNIFYLASAFEAVDGFSVDFLDEFYGEDTDLGWKVVESGYRSAFCSDALVYHEVFRVSLYKWLAEPLYFKNLPYLVHKHPELRQSMYRRYFLTRESALFNLFLAAVLAGYFQPLVGIAAALPYLAARYRSGNRFNGPHLRLLRVAAGVPRNLFAWVALVRGSIRARTLLL